MTKTRVAGIPSPQMRSDGGLMPHEIPMISEAELAGRNSGLDMVASSLKVLDVARSPDEPSCHPACKYNDVIYEPSDRFVWHSSVLLRESRRS